MNSFSFILFAHIHSGAAHSGHISLLALDKSCVIGRSFVSTDDQSARPCRKPSSRALPWKSVWRSRELSSSRSARALPNLSKGPRSTLASARLPLFLHSIDTATFGFTRHASFGRSLWGYRRVIPTQPFPGKGRGVALTRAVNTTLPAFHSPTQETRRKG